MPFFKAKINFSLDEEQEKNLKTELGKAVQNNFGYSKEYLLAIFEENQKIYLRGEKTEKIAYIVVEVFGNKFHAGYKNFSRDVTIIFSEILKITEESQLNAEKFQKVYESDAEKSLELDLKFC